MSKRFASVIWEHGFKTNWRLRSAGNNNNNACNVDSDGYVNNNNDVNNTDNGVRPICLRV